MASLTRSPASIGDRPDHVLRFDCSSGTRRGIVLGSASGVDVNGYAWRGTVIQPKDVGIQIGDRGPADAVHNQVFYVTVRGEGNKATRLVEFNDSDNGVFLETYTPATGGDWDVALGETARDAFLMPMTGRGRLRVKREGRIAADFSKFDVARHEVLPHSFRPESLAGYERVEQGSGTVGLESGGVVLDTGSLDGSEANVRKRMNVNFGRLRFDNPAALQTNVQIADNVGQEAWLVWGDREGPAIGWRIVDDRLEGYVHRGRGNATTVDLRTGFAPGAAWNLTAFYNPPTDVRFYMDDLATQRVSLTGDDSEILVTAGAQDGNEGFFHRGRDARYGGTVSRTCRAGPPTPGPSRTSTSGTRPRRAKGCSGRTGSSTSIRVVVSRERRPRPLR